MTTKAPAPLDPGLEFVGPNRRGVAFYSCYFVRLPDGRVLSIDEEDVPESYQEYSTSDEAVTRRDEDTPFDSPRAVGGAPPTLEELAAALLRRAERRKAASAERRRQTPARGA